MLQHVVILDFLHQDGLVPVHASPVIRDVLRRIGDEQCTNLLCEHWPDSEETTQALIGQRDLRILPKLKQEDEEENGWISRILVRHLHDINEVELRNVAALDLPFVRMIIEHELKRRQQV